MTAALCATAMLGAPSGHTQTADAGLDGCREGSVMTGRLVPGTGSVGENIRREAALRQCASPLLPGIESGTFIASIPWSAPGATSTAQFAWSDGSISTATGYGNGLWLITGGPATGHGIQIHVADTWIGWYYTWNDVVVTSATFVS